MRFLQMLFGAKAKPAARERRGLTRMRTRLRPGKLLDRSLSFVADCTILDRTSEGVRIRSFGEPASVGELVAVFDDTDRNLRPGRVIWSRNGEAGIWLDEVAPFAADPKVVRRYSAPYYAVTD